MTKTTIWMIACAMATTVYAQEAEIPLMDRAEQKTINQQAAAIDDALRPVVRRASQSAVWVWAKNARGREIPVCYGTVVGNGTRALAKWSEVALSYGSLRVSNGDNQVADANVIGVYKDEDLVLLELKGATFTPADFSKPGNQKLGQFLAAATPDGFSTAGVVSVLERSLRDADQPFLGVIMKDAGTAGGGLPIDQVEPNSAAQRAGLRSGDEILSLDGQEITSPYELRISLLKHKPGDTVKLSYKRQGVASITELQLQEKPELEAPESGRLQTMERMGGDLSLVRSGFPSVMQTDMQLLRQRCGGPVVDLDGNIVGISIARADRTRSYVIPAAAVVKLLEKTPVAPQLAAAQQATGQAPRPRVIPPGMSDPGGDDADDESQASGPRPQMVPARPQDAESLRRHLEELSRLIDRFDEEMAGVGE
jgi:S1-C subfamily serine protease